MTDEVFILHIKALYKNYYQNGRSVGMQVRRLVRQFRQDVQQENFNPKRKKRKIINENLNKDRS
ncbi:hypothetical protein [Halpernia humi]|uniref:hypothetical protein n=1 Tax=Halpernia humi TaxID=493375 RepID=UPI0011AFEF6B|nr:hypothetical protein [Halpernia humi]